MTLRPCLGPPGGGDCPDRALARDDSRCPRCRPTTAERGYGGAHKRARAAGIEAAYGQLCSRFDEDPQCSGVMERGQELDLDHTDDRRGYRGFAHSECNRRAGGLSRGTVTLSGRDGSASEAR